MKKYPRLAPPVLVLLVLLLFAEGCGLRRIALGKGGIGRIRGKQITSVVSAPAPFYAESPATAEERSNKGIYGFLSGVWEWMFESAALEKRGKTLIEEFGIADPAVTVRDGFTAHLEKDLGFTAVSIEKEGLSDGSIPALRERFGTGMVLEFTTTSWKLQHASGDWKLYRVSLTVRGRLVDLGSSEVLWRDACSSTGAEAFFGELMAGGGAGLKHALDEAAGRCAAGLEERFGGSK